MRIILLATLLVVQLSGCITINHRLPDEEVVVPEGVGNYLSIISAGLIDRGIVTSKEEYDDVTVLYLESDLRDFDGCRGIRPYPVRNANAHKLFVGVCYSVHWEVMSDGATYFRFVAADCILE